MTVHDIARRLPEPTALHAHCRALAMLEAVRHVLSSRPLTEAVVRALNPEASLADLAQDIAEIGHPVACDGHQPGATSRARHRRGGGVEAGLPRAG
ncbi:hypothetical protein ACFY8K_22500 [Streptomyces misionensis]|uniref:hypothetical protein n=1 Tax=Streptomyces misionensis TaxID=67331 RepID=UPI0036AEEACD